MKFRHLYIVAAIVTGLLGSAAFAEDPEGVPMGEVQNGDPDAEQHYTPGDATIAGEGTQAYGDASVSEINPEIAAAEFDGSDPDRESDPSETNIGTVVEPNSE